MPKYWGAWRQASCLPDCWCEAPRWTQPIAEPVNAFSNIAFLIGGLFILRLLLRKDNHPNLITNNKDITYFYAFVMMAMGVGSFLFHSTVTFVGQWIDVMTMYFSTLFYIGYLLWRKYNWQKKKFFLFYFVSNVILGLTIYYTPATRRYLFGITIAITAFLTLYVRNSVSMKTQMKFLWISLAALGVAFISWNLDRTKIVCDPTYWINGHAIWHLLCAASAYYYYRYLYSENEVA